MRRIIPTLLLAMACYTCPLDSYGSEKNYMFLIFRDTSGSTAPIPKQFYPDVEQVSGPQAEFKQGVVYALSADRVQHLLIQCQFTLVSYAWSNDTPHELARSTSPIRTPSDIEDFVQAFISENWSATRSRTTEPETILQFVYELLQQNSSIVPVVLIHYDGTKHVYGMNANRYLKGIRDRGGSIHLLGYSHNQDANPFNDLVRVYDLTRSEEEAVIDSSPQFEEYPNHIERMVNRHCLSFVS
jgi:hypothetical protein